MGWFFLVDNLMNLNDLFFIHVRWAHGESNDEAVIQVDSRQNQCVASRVVFDKLPKLGRKYYRNGSDTEGDDDGSVPPDDTWPDDRSGSQQVASNKEDRPN